MPEPRSVLVTGGNRGLGMGLVKRLAERTDVASLATGGLRVTMRFATHSQPSLT